ncbi:hypothetical protein KLMIMM047B_29835 [Klebsiella michiganensis]
MNMFLKQRQGGHAAMASDVIIRNNGHINQRESVAVECACQRWVVKLIQGSVPAEGEMTP